MADNDQLKAAFMAFANFGAGANTKHVLDSRSYVKLLKDSGLMTKGYSTTSADIHFMKHKEKAAKVINYEQFCRCLDEVANVRKCTTDEVVEKIINASPSANGATVPEAVKYHDDKNLYTGVYANGGPQAVDKFAVGAGGKMSNLTNRDNKADIRGAVHM